MSVYRPKNSPFYHYDFQIGGHRFHGSTKCGAKREAEQVEAIERDKAAKLVDANLHSKTGPLTLDLAADRYWVEAGQYRANAKGLETDLAMVVKFLGPDTLLSDIGDDQIAKLVSWRRGHYRWGKKKFGYITPSHVNRSATEVIQRVFTRAIKAWKIPLPNAPDWSQHMLAEPEERVRELRDDEDEIFTAVLREDYEELRKFSLASGLRMKESLLTWSQVDFAARVVIVTGKGGKIIRKPMTTAMREILIGRKGHHPIFVFTYKAVRTRQNRLRGERYPITRSGLKSHWRRAKARGGIVDYRWHDNRHTFATNLLRTTQNLKLVKMALNHSKLETTDKYAHVLDEELRAGMEAAEQNRVKKSRNNPRTPGKKIA